MDILILGGTKFVGRALVEAAQAAGHTITLFNRGQTNPDLFPEVEHLRGDRDGDLGALRGRRWHTVIDTCGYVPRIVRQSAELLAGAVEHYVFISSISVYPFPVSAGSDETADVAALEDETVEEVTGETYGALKALCEQAVETALPGRALRVRAGLIVGPFDPTDRFTYWPARLARGGEALCPPAGSPVQFVDVRDLAAWIIRMAEKRQAGVYNATGPAQPLTFGPLLSACLEAGGGKSTLVECTEDFLTEHQVAPWSDLPLWLPVPIAGISQVSVSKAISAGLALRPISETVRDTLAWYRANHEDGAALKAGLSPAREAEVIALWKQALMRT